MTLLSLGFSFSSPPPWIMRSSQGERFIFVFYFPSHLGLLPCNPKSIILGVDQFFFVDPPLLKKKKKVLRIMLGVPSSFFLLLAFGFSWHPVSDSGTPTYAHTHKVQGSPGRWSTFGFWRSLNGPRYRYLVSKPTGSIWKTIRARGGKGGVLFVCV